MANQEFSRPLKGDNTSTGFSGAVENPQLNALDLLKEGRTLLMADNKPIPGHTGGKVTEFLCNYPLPFFSSVCEAADTMHDANKNAKKK